MLRGELKKAEEIIQDIKDSIPPQYTILEAALESAGVENYYILPAYQGLQVSYIRRAVKIDGIRVEVTLNLDTGELLFDGEPKECFSLRVE